MGFVAWTVDTGSVWVTCLSVQMCDKPFDAIHILQRNQEIFVYNAAHLPAIIGTCNSILHVSSVQQKLVFINPCKTHFYNLLSLCIEYFISPYLSHFPVLHSFLQRVKLDITTPTARDNVRKTVTRADVTNLMVFAWAVSHCLKEPSAKVLIEKLTVIFLFPFSAFIAEHEFIAHSRYLCAFCVLIRYSSFFWLLPWESIIPKPRNVFLVGES